MASARTWVTERPMRFAAVATAVNLLITVPLASYLNVWEDDAYTLHTTSGSLAYAWQQSIVFEQNAPLYFILLTLWRHIDPSFFFARLFSVLCVALVVALIPSLVQRYLPQLNATWITFAVALNPFMVWAAVEIRLYALAMLLAGLLLLAFYDGFLAARPSRAAQIWYVVLSILAAYTQYFLICLIVAQGALLLTRNRKALLRYLFGQFVVIAAFIPMLIIIPEQLQSFRVGYTPPHSLLQSAYVVASILGSYVLGLQAYPHRQLLYAIAVCAALVAIIAMRKSFTTRGDFALPLMTIVAGALLATIIYVEREHVINRHAAFMYVPMTFSIYAFFTFLREPMRSRAVAVWSCVAIVVGLGCLYFTYRPLAKAGDWARVTAFLHSAERPNEPILVFEAEDTLPLKFYYHGPNRVVGVPNEIDYRTYDVSEFVIHDDRELDRAVAAIPRHHPFWFVISGWCEDGNTAFGCNIVEDYVEHRLVTLEERSFYMTSVRLVERR